jgi:hypothetical protein
MPGRSLRFASTGVEPSVDTTLLHGSVPSPIRSRSCRATERSRDISLDLPKPIENATTVEVSPLRAALRDPPVDTTLLRRNVPHPSDSGHLERPTGAERSPWAGRKRAVMLMPGRLLHSGPPIVGPSVEATCFRRGVPFPNRSVVMSSGTEWSRDISLDPPNTIRDAVPVEVSPLRAAFRQPSGRDDGWSKEGAIPRSYAPFHHDCTREVTERGPLGSSSS